MSNQVRQNYHEECEMLVNKQINMELYASYVYMSMGCYFDRDDVHLPGLKKFFMKNSDEEREHAMKFIKYQNQRGGRVVLKDIAEPKVQDWGTALNAMTSALELEKQVNQSLLDLHKKAGEHDDPHLTKLLEDEYLEEQVEAIKELAGYITQLKRVGPGLGEYTFDHELDS